MTFVRRFSATLLLCTVAFTSLNAFAAKKPAAKSDDATPAYKGAIVTDAVTGNVLFEDHADIVSPPASMTKLMSFVIVHDKLASGALTLSTPVQITVDDAHMGGTQVFLDPRETFSVEELLYAMMIQSANDAAHALSHAAAGSPEAFVELMNAKAHEIGMTHTTFRSPHGLPPHSRKIADGDLTTPRDFAILSRYALLNTDVLKYTSVHTRDFGTGRAKGPQHMKNHNNLLGKVGGVDGLKTGYTEGAGYCLAATSERNGRRIIAVVMGSFGPHGEKDLGRTRDRKTIELLERGFAALPAGGPAFKATASAAVPAANTAAAAKPTPPPPASDSPISAAPATTTTADDQPPTIKFAIPAKKK